MLEIDDHVTEIMHTVLYASLTQDLIKPLFEGGHGPSLAFYRYVHLAHPWRLGSSRSIERSAGERENIQSPQGSCNPD